MTQLDAHSSRSIIETIQEADGFKYSERSAQNRESGGGARFKYVCQDSLQSKRRGVKKEKSHDSEDNEDEAVMKEMYDCGGAIYIKFSIKREAINVVFKHNPIHSHQVHEERYVHRLNDRIHDPLAAFCITGFRIAYTNLIDRD